MKKIVVIGSLNMDTTVQVQHIPVTGETILSNDVALNPGGKGANQAYAAGKIGGNVAMIGAVGQDSNGIKLRENLEDVGVDISAVAVRENGTTGMAFVMVNQEGDNSIVVVPGTNATVSTEDIEQNIEQLENSDIVILQMEIPAETVLYVAKKAKMLGKTVILDPAPVPEHFPDELYEYVDILKPNETELSMLTGIKVDSEESIQKAIAMVREKGARDVVVTLGKQGVYVSSELEGEVRIPSLEVKVVDTTAAGDTFVAALATKLAQGEKLVEAAEFANQVSGMVVARKGAQSSVPSRAEIEAIEN